MEDRPSRPCLAVVVVLAILSACAPGTFAGEGDPSAGAIWRVDLRPKGYIENIGRRPRFASDTRISFISDDLLIASFWTETTPDGCTWKEKSPPDACRLHAVEVEVGTGRIRSTHEWSFPFREGFIYPTGRGSFVLSGENELDLYSSNFEELKKVSLPSAEPGLPMLFVNVSPSGKTLLADWTSSSMPPQPVGSKRARTAQRQIPHQMNAIFETADMKELRRWDERFFAQSISDNLLVASTGFDFFFLSRPGFLISRFDERGWQDLNVTGHWFLTTVKLLDDQHVVVQERNRVTVLNTNGVSLFEDTNFRKRHYLSGNPVTSADGLRFAAAVWVDSPHPFWVSPVGIQTELLVYDVPHHGRIYSRPLDAATHVGKLWVFHDFALSLDGALLAHTADGFVELYRLPSNKSVDPTP